MAKSLCDPVPNNASMASFNTDLYKEFFPEEDWETWKDLITKSLTNTDEDGIHVSLHDRVMALAEGAKHYDDATRRQAILGIARSQKDVVTEIIAGWTNLFKADAPEWTVPNLGLKTYKDFMWAYRGDNDKLIEKLAPWDIDHTITAPKVEEKVPETRRRYNATFFLYVIGVEGAKDALITQAKEVDPDAKFETNGDEWVNFNKTGVAFTENPNFVETTFA